MAIHDEHRESNRKQLDDAKAKQLLYEHRVTRLEIAVSISQTVTEENACITCAT